MELHLCPDCKNFFVQEFTCITCGAQRLYDETVRSLQAEVRHWRSSAESLAIRIIGQEAFDNSPCQANPLELVEEAVKDLRTENARLQPSTVEFYGTDG